MPVDEGRGQNGKTDARYQSLRLIFEYRGDDVKLVSVERVNMKWPPPQALSRSANQTGSWFELRDGKDNALYRLTIANPIERNVEVIADSPQDLLVRLPVDQPSGTFFLIVPDLASASKLALSTERSSGAESAKSNGTLIEFPLSKAQR